MRRRDFTSLALAGTLGTLLPASGAAQARLGDHRRPAPTEPGRLAADRSFAVILDVQESFLAKLSEDGRSRVLYATQDFANLATRLGIPIVVTLEKPVAAKGGVPPEIGQELTAAAKTLEKAYYDLSREASIRAHLSALGRQQAIVAGCETDVCVLQSCLGLLGLGYEVYVVEDLLFTSSPNADAALARMKAAGAIFLTYKTLYYELTQTIEFESAFDEGPMTQKLSP